MVRVGTFDGSNGRRAGLPRPDLAYWCRYVLNASCMSFSTQAPDRNV
jgi:hypothetical protein